ncbi:MAG: nuclear transport factor 2 family protein [Anaerolineales bacterium]|nr:nuclear transport factor 2 family protein [Anaerolineales bacterium]
MMLYGKGMFIWQLNRIAGGNVSKMVDKALSAGLSHVLIKIADGDRASNRELLKPATIAFQSAGIQTWGWAWIWLEDPVQEAEIAARKCEKLGLDGFVINAEHPAKGKEEQARAYMDMLCDRLRDLPIGLSSYRYPQHHRTVPWEALLSRCTVDMPQMYWAGESPDKCVMDSLDQHRMFPFSKPVIPTGAAYGEQYGRFYFRSEPHEIKMFLDTVRENGLAAANFWSWDWTEIHGPDLWDAIAAYDWPKPEESLDMGEQFWQALVANDLNMLADLYHSNAIYVSANATVQGPTEIQEQFRILFSMIPGATFVKDELRTDGMVRYLYWRAESDTCRIINGLDTIGLRSGRIQYHASSYQWAPVKA